VALARLTRDQGALSAAVAEIFLLLLVTAVAGQFVAQRVEASVKALPLAAGELLAQGVEVGSLTVRAGLRQRVSQDGGGLLRLLWRPTLRGIKPSNHISRGCPAAAPSTMRSAWVVSSPRSK